MLVPWNPGPCLNAKWSGTQATLTLCHSLPILFCNYSIFNDKSEILTVASWISQEGIHPSVQRVRDPLWLLSGLW